MERISKGKEANKLAEGRSWEEMIENCFAKTTDLEAEVALLKRKAYSRPLIISLFWGLIRIEK